MILETLGIYGWKDKDQNLLLSSILTGDPLLMIGRHGSAKSAVCAKLANALNRKFMPYDASKAVFEDLIGFPNIKKLGEGVVEYVPSSITLWTQEYVLIDELNRAIPELQSKWLEIIRARRVMGFETQVKWVWAAMNPMSYSATQALDEALIGRFAFFVYPPDVLQMEEQDRVKVTEHINGDDAPAISVWNPEQSCLTVAKQDVEQIGQQMTRMLQKAARHFNALREQYSTLSLFLARFADLLMRESKGEISLDGRRLGFIYRNILANRAVEIAKSEVIGTAIPDFVKSARYVVQSSIPVGLNDESLKKEEAVHKMEICFDLLSSFFAEGSDMEKVNIIYELFTTKDLMRKAEILLTANLGEFAASKAWNDLINGEQDITLLAYTALQVEARRPGTVPRELLEGLSRKVSGEKLSSKCIPNLQGECIEFVEEVEELLDQQSDLAKIVAYSHVAKLARKQNLDLNDIEQTREANEKDLETFELLISNHHQSTANGGEVVCKQSS